MPSRFLKLAPLNAALSGVAWLALAVTPAGAQHRYYLQPCPPPMQPAPCAPAPLAPVPGTPTTPTPPTTPTAPDQVQPTAPTTEAAFDPGAGAGDVSTAVGGAAFAATMLGDQLGIPALAFALRNRQSAPIVPSARGLKISENESPRPLDRVYYTYHYFEDVNAAVNRRFGSPLTNIRAHRHTFGLEKTFTGGSTSVGLRVPLNQLDSSSTVAGFGGTDTAFGDLTLVTKWAFWENDETGSLLSTGLSLTLPTGPQTFAGSPDIVGAHSVVFQPYLGYIWNRDRLFVHGFSSVNIVTQANDVTFMSNDIGIGYRLYRSDNSCAWLTSIVPTFEVHVNTPLDHRGALDISDPFGMPDIVNLTFGTTFGIGSRSTLALGYVCPVTGPRPFDYEFLLQFNWRFGRSVSTPTTPILGN